MLAATDYQSFGELLEMIPHRALLKAASADVSFPGF